MRKILLSMFVVLMSAFTYADEITFNASSDKSESSAAGAVSLTKNGVTIAVSSGVLGNGTDYRIYKGQTITISTNTGNITSIAFTCTASGTTKYGPGCFATPATGSYAYSGAAGTWTGSASEVVLTASSNQVRATEIVVTTGSAASVETPTFSLPSGTYDGPQTVTLSCATDGASMIYYFGDNAGDYTEYTEYGQEIAINQSCTLHAIAYLNGEQSEVATANYVILPFVATDKNGKAISSKFAASPLTVKYLNDATGLTFKVNGKETTYDAAAGLTIKTTAQKNENDTVSVYNGDELVAEKIYTWIPTVGVSTYKTLEDGSEAILSLAKNNKVTYVSADGKTAFLEDASKGIEAYNLGLTLDAYKTVTSGLIWGKKTTYNGIVEIIAADSTAACSSITQTTTDVTPTALTVAQTLLENNQLRYAKLSGAKIIIENNKYYAVSGADTVQIYDGLKTGLLSTTTIPTTPCFADVTGIVACYKDVIEVYPTAIDNISDKITGVCGGVTWTIDMDGNMVFTPTDGVSGVMDATGTAASKRPWSANVSSVKTVKFDAGVTAGSDISYMFKDMTNLESVDFTNFVIPATTVKAKALFTGCSSLKSADLSCLSLEQMTDVSSLFTDCTSLTDVNFGDFTASTVTTFETMFNNCSSLETLDLSKFANTTATKMTSMFNGCSSLKTLDIRGISTASVTKAANAKTVFGSTCLPTTLTLNKGFGLLGDGSYVALPSVTYEANGTSYTLPTQQEQFYTDLANAADYVTYTQSGTGINSISAVTGSTIFNLAGQRVSKAQKGIYIVNGKKVLK